MDTKSKKYRWQHHWAVKAAVVLICLVCVLDAFQSIFHYAVSGNGIQLLWEGYDYEKSYQIRSEASAVMGDVIMVEQLKDEHNIRNTYDEWKIYYYDEANAAYEERIYAAHYTLDTSMEEAQASWRADLISGEDYVDLQKQYQSDYNRAMAEAKQMYEAEMLEQQERRVQEKIYDFNHARQNLTQYREEGWRYAQVPREMTQEDAQTRFAEEIIMMRKRLDDEEQDTDIIVTMEKNAYFARALEYNAAKGWLDKVVLTAGIELAVLLLAILWLGISAGNRPAATGVSPGWPGWIYLDVHTLIVAGITAVCVSGVLVIAAGMYNENISTVNNALMFFCHACLVIAVLTLLWWYTAVIKRIKRGEFFSHTLWWQAGRCIGRCLRAVFSYSAGHWMGIGAIVLYTLLACGIGTALAVGSPVLIIPAVILNGIAIAAAWLVKNHQMKCLKQDVEAIMRGEEHAFSSTGDRQMDAVAKDARAIQQSMDDAVKRQVKAERMRAELVTNVSHDLKTPLTSIISYVDLLKREGPGSPNATEYIAILEQKSQRLKQLTEDLFEAAKASSGSIQVDMGQVDVAALISQGMGEMGDSLENSQLEFVLQMPPEPLWVWADGRLLWRVMENLLTNALKYSMPGSRVYLSVQEQDDRAIIEMKNISRQMLNMPEQELMERFTRGDAARNSEGSGLGLAIANSLTDLQRGKFVLSIDGDLFKAQVILQLWREQEISDTAK